MIKLKLSNVQPRVHTLCSPGCHQSNEDLESGRTSSLGVWCSKIQCPTEWTRCPFLKPLPFLVFPLPLPLQMLSGKVLGPSRGGNSCLDTFGSGATCLSFDPVRLWAAFLARTKLKNIRFLSLFLGNFAAGIQCCGAEDRSGRNSGIGKLTFEKGTTKRLNSSWRRQVSLPPVCLERRLALCSRVPLSGPNHVFASDS